MQTYSGVVLLYIQESAKLRKRGFSSIRLKSLCNRKYLVQVLCRFRRYTTTGGVVIKPGMEPIRARATRKTYFKQLHTVYNCP